MSDKIKIKEHDATCPKCSGWMVPLAGAEARVDSCTDCRGVWLTPDTLRRCAEARTPDAAELARVLAQKPPDRGYPAGLKCPGCGWLMMQHSYHGQEIERCPRCSGIYFDRGELERVLAAARQAPAPAAASSGSSSSGLAAEVAVEGGWIVGEVAVALLVGIFEALAD